MRLEYKPIAIPNGYDYWVHEFITVEGKGMPLGKGMIGKACEYIRFHYVEGICTRPVELD